MAKAQAPVTENGKFYDIKSLGSLLKCTSQENVELTHDLARELLAMPQFAGERPRRKTHVSSLVHHMDSGTFHWNLVAIISCKCGEPHNEKPKGTTFRMNGQHTCLARLELPASMRAPIRMLRYSAATEADMRRLYSTIDRNAPRTKGNVIHSYINGTSEFDGYHSVVRKYLPTGMALWRWERSADRTRHGAEDVAYLLLKEEAAVTQQVANFVEQFKSREYKHIMRAPVIAAMLETFSRSSSKAADFWTAVTTGLGLTSEKDPRKKLHKMLLTTAVGSAGGKRAMKLSSGAALPPEAMYRLCVHIFNAWRKGEQISTLRIPEKRPVAIA